MSEQPHDYPRLSENHAKKFRALKQKKYRDKEQTFLAEGLRLCEEAVSANLNTLQTIITKEALEQPRIEALIRNVHAAGMSVLLADSRLFNSISDEKSPQGILCVVEKKAVLSISDISTRLILACDNVQDPGNLGTIFRSAEWFGVTDILLSPGCVDPYNSKVVRGSMGAIFRLNIFENVNFASTLSDFKLKGYRTIGALLNAPTYLADVQPNKDILLIGNEANGLSPDVIPLIDEPITIPGAGRGESLNAAIAASICLYHFSQS